jgi:hypothetical protein
MRAVLLLLPLMFGYVFSAQSQDIIYHGKIMRGEDGCPTLIKIKSAENGPISHHLILPTGNLPEDWHYGQKITFTMTPLRQPIPSDCKAQVVASIQILMEPPKRKND